MVVFIIDQSNNYRLDYTINPLVYKKSKNSEKYPSQFPKALPTVLKYVNRMNVCLSSELNKVNLNIGHPQDAVIGCPFANICLQLRIANGPS